MHFTGFNPPPPSYALTPPEVTVSIQTLAKVLESSQATLCDRLVLIAIANHTDAHDANAFPSVATIAREARVSTSKVHQSIRSLTALGELQWTGRLSAHGTRIYRVSVDNSDVSVNKSVDKGGAKFAGGCKNSPVGGAKFAPESSRSSLTVKKEIATSRGEQKSNSRANAAARSAIQKLAEKLVVNVSYAEPSRRTGPQTVATCRSQAWP